MLKSKCTPPPALRNEQKPRPFPSARLHQRRPAPFPRPGPSRSEKAFASGAAGCAVGTRVPTSIQPRQSASFSAGPRQCPTSLWSAPRRSGTHGRVLYERTDRPGKNAPPLISRSALNTQPMILMSSACNLNLCIAHSGAALPRNQPRWLSSPKRNCAPLATPSSSTELRRPRPCGSARTVNRLLRWHSGSCRISRRQFGGPPAEINYSVILGVPVDPLFAIPGEKTARGNT